MKVIKIGATWCNGCLVMRPRWQKIETQLPWLETEYYDFDQDQEHIQAYQLDMATLPTFIFVDKKGEEFLRLSGEVAESELLKVIEENRER